MAVQNDPQHHALTRVADVSDAKPAAAHGKNGPARPTSGNANSPGGTLPDVKRDRDRFRSAEIDLGVKITDPSLGRYEGQDLITHGIEVVLRRIVGGKTGDYFPDRLADYGEAKPIMDKILTYPPRSDKEFARLLDGVNKHLQSVVVYDFLMSARNKSHQPIAERNAVYYVTDTAGPNSLSPNARLKGLLAHMKAAQIDQKIIAGVQKNCEQAIAYAP